MRIKCEQCDKVFKKATREACLASMRMHVGRVHGNIQNHPETPADDPARQRRLDYQREWRRKQKARSNGATPVACFCPRCGMDLQLLAMALTVVKKAKS